MQHFRPFLAFRGSGIPWTVRSLQTSGEDDDLQENKNGENKEKLIGKINRPFLGDTESVCDERLRLCRDWDGRTSSEDFRDDDEAEEALEN